MLSKLHFKAIFVSLGVFLLIMASTAVFFVFAKKSLDQKIKTAFETKNQEIIKATNQDLSSYINVLYGVRGFFSASEQVERDEFVTYINALNLKIFYPGLHSIRFNKVTNNQFFITYTSEEEVIGLNASLLPIREKTMGMARDTNNVAISPRIETLSGGQPGFVISIPIYSSDKLDTVEQRQKNIFGFVNGIVLLDEFFNQSLLSKQDTLADIHLEIDDRQEENSIISLFTYNSDNLPPGHKKAFFFSENYKENTLQVTSRKWTFHFWGDPEYGLSGLERYSLWILLFSGFFLGLSFSFFVYNLYQTRIKIIRRAEELSAELQKKEVERMDLLEKNTRGLTKQNKELLQVRTAILNILEDTEKDKVDISEANARNEAILSSIGDCVVATDEKGLITRVNHETEKKLGWLSGELVGKPYTKALILLDENSKPIPNEERKINLVLRTGQKIITSLSSATHSYVKKDGSSFPVAVSTTPIILGGKIIGAIAVFRDIAHDKSIDQAKTEFVSLASHQLRTPLSTINWYVEMLLSKDAGEINEEQEKFLKEIYRGSKRMVELVNALLNVSRLELGTFTIEPKPTDLVALAEDVVRELLPQIKEKELNLSSVCQKNGTVCPILPPVNVDPKLMRIVFQNLLTNAVKYTLPKGSINISLDQNKDKKELILKVCDSGIGIPREAQDKIFTKLFRADNARETDADGTGLGLYIVKAIIEESGGKIRFKSIPDQGTTFFITLPLPGMTEKEGTKKLS